jgi:hypothetical protein
MQFFVLSFAPDAAFVPLYSDSEQVSCAIKALKLYRYITFLLDCELNSGWIGMQFEVQ